MAGGTTRPRQRKFRFNGNSLDILFNFCAEIVSGKSNISKLSLISVPRFRFQYKYTVPRSVPYIRKLSPDLNISTLSPDFTLFPDLSPDFSVPRFLPRFGQLGCLARTMSRGHGSKVSADPGAGKCLTTETSGKKMAGCQDLSNLTL